MSHSGQSSSQSDSAETLADSISEISGVVNGTTAQQWESECNFFYADCCLDNGTLSVSCDNETFYVGTSYNYSSPYLMPWPQRTGWIAVFSLMLVVATVGNALVAWIVFAHKRMKTVNLSLADLTMSLFNCIFNFTFMLNSHWPFGGFYCTVSNFIANMTVAASVFTLVTISFDRYIVIVYPLRPRMSKNKARIIICFIWLASCTLATPCLLYSETLSHSYANGEIRTICFTDWPDGTPPHSQQEFIYNIVFTLVTYLIPVIVMGASYTRMGCVLWVSKSIGDDNLGQAESIRSKRKIARMFTVIVTLFVVCWLPYHVYFVYQFFDRDVNRSKHVQHIYLGFYWLAMSNTMINPLIYYFMNSRFRQHYKSTLLRCLCCVKGKPSAQSQGTRSIPNVPRSALLIIRNSQSREDSNRNGISAVSLK